MKDTWNKLIAWKMLGMEMIVYGWITECDTVYDKIAVEFDELPDQLFHLFDMIVRQDLDETTEVYNRESYQACPLLYN